MGHIRSQMIKAFKPKKPFKAFKTRPVLMFCISLGKNAGKLGLESLNSLGLGVALGGGRVLGCGCGGWRLPITGAPGTEPSLLGLSK